MSTVTTTYGDLVIPPSFIGDGGITVSIHFKAGDADLLEAFESNEFNAVHLNCNWTGLSNQFRSPFRENPSLFSEMLAEVGQAVVRESGCDTSSIRSVSLSAFSAGYGAIQEILKQSEHDSIIKSIFMLDSLYADWISEEVRVPRLQDVLEFMMFAQVAARREKTLVVTHADYDCDHAGYCSTRKTADLLLAAVGGSRQPGRGSLALSIPPTSECHVGNFHLMHFATRDHHSQLRLLPSLWSVYGLGCALPQGQEKVKKLYGLFRSKEN